MKLSELKNFKENAQKVFKDFKSNHKIKHGALNLSNQVDYDGINETPESFIEYFPEFFRQTATLGLAASYIEQKRKLEEELEKNPSDQSKKSKLASVIIELGNLYENIEFKNNIALESVTERINGEDLAKIQEKLGISPDLLKAARYTMFIPLGELDKLISSQLVQ